MATFDQKGSASSSLERKKVLVGNFDFKCSTSFLPNPFFLWGSSTTKSVMIAK